MLEELITDNPMLVRFLRSRLRKQIMIATVAITIIAAFFFAWGGCRYRDMAEPLFYILILCQCAVLFLAGSARVASAVSHARHTGLLDFHRISPQKPLALVLGFLCGAPILEVIVFGCIVPFVYVLAIAADANLAVLSLFYLGIVIAAALYFAAAILIGMQSASAPGTATSAMLLLLILLHALCAVPFVSHLTVIPLFYQLTSDGAYSPFLMTFFLVTLPPIALALLHQLIVLAFLLFASVRKMQSAHAYALSKPMAVALFVAFVCLLVGDTYSAWHSSFDDTLFFVFLVVLLVASVCLSLIVTPNVGTIMRGIRQARKSGRSHPSLWSDLAPNWPPLVVFSSLVLLAGLFTILPTMLKLLPAVGIGACALLIFGLAKQYSDLTFGKRGLTLFVLCVVLLWTVPLPVGLSLVFSYERSYEALATVLSAISPLMGILYTSTYDTITFTQIVVILCLYLAQLIIAVAFYMRALRRTVAIASDDFLQAQEPIKIDLSSRSPTAAG